MSAGSGNFFDLNDLLAGDERVKCTFLTDAVDCAYLDPSCVGDDLKSGAVVELPLWLAEPLALRGDVAIEVPQFLTPRFRRIMKAGPASVNLREFSPYVYEVARHVVPLVEEPEAKEIDEIMRLAFGGDRFREILNNSMNSMNEDTTEFTRKLTEEEKRLFQAGAHDSKDFMMWKGRHADVISAAAVVERTSKRHLSVFRHQWPPPPSYAVAFGYGLGDTYDKATRAQRAIDAQGASPQKRNALVATATFDTLLWQTLASVAIPGFTINRVVALTASVANKTLTQSPVLRRWAPTAIGLGLIPLIIHPIDHLVDSLLDASTREWADDYIRKQE